MKIRVRPGLQAIVTAMSLAITLFAVSQASATTNSDLSDQLLYRVRHSAPWRGEIVGRFFIERNIPLATQLGIVGDYDPDGDGWAIVGHTDTDYDSKTIGGFMISNKKVPSIMLYWDNDTQCASLTPISLAVVEPDQDRLLKATIQRMCFAPQTTVVVTVNPAVPEPVVLEQDAETVTEQQLITPPQSSENQTIQQADGLPQLTQMEQVSTGFVAGTSTTKQVSYFDGHGHVDTEPVKTVENAMLTGGSIIVAASLGAVLVLRTYRLLTR